MKTKLHLTITALGFILGTVFTLAADAQSTPGANGQLDRDPKRRRSVNKNDETNI